MKLYFNFNSSLKRKLLPADHRLWLLRSVALQTQPDVETVWTFEIYHRRLLIGLVVLGLVGWLTAASALFYWLNRQPHNQIGWPDLVAPWRWSGLRVKRGETAMLAALDDLKVHDYGAAFYKLGVCLARSPGNVTGRLILAQLTAGFDPLRAVTLVEEGIPSAGTDPKFISGLLSIYQSQQIQSHALIVLGDLLATARPEGMPAASRLGLQRAQVGLLTQLGRYSEAEQMLNSIQTPDGSAEQAALTILRIELLLRTDRTAEAKTASALALARHPQEALLWSQSAEVAVTLGDSDALQSALRRLKAKSPEEPKPYLFAIQMWHRLKRRSMRDQAEEEYYRLFGTNDMALQSLAALAVNLEMPEVLTRAQRVAAAARLSTFAYKVHQTELALRRGEFESATRYLHDWKNDVDTLPAGQRFYPEFIRRLSYAATANTPAQVTYLLTHLGANRGQATVAIQLLASSVLERSGNPAGAAEVLRAALRIYPNTDALLRAEKKITEVLAAASPQTPILNNPRTPTGPHVLLPASADEARARLNELLGKDEFFAARNLCHAILKQKPDWGPQIAAEVAAREVELDCLTLDPTDSRSSARAYVSHYTAESELLLLVGVTQRLAARGQLFPARVLNDELVTTRWATPAIRQALHKLKLPDDLAEAVATQTAALAALDHWILNQQWAQAEPLLKRLRDQPPAWLAGGSAEVKVREVQVRLGLGPRLLALENFKELVIKSGPSRSAAFKLVRALQARGEVESARLLAREIVRLLPDDPAAAHLLKETAAPGQGS